MLGDGQFESMRGEIADMGALLNVVSEGEHVPEIERHNRTIKDRVRCIYNMQIAKHFPPVFIVEMVYASVFWRNMFALKGDIFTTQSPAEFILNRKIDYNAHCKVEFGDYVQTHEEHDNTMATRTVGAIATRPTGNIQGGYYFIRLDTGRRIMRRDWTPLPMPSEVVDQIHRLARRAKASTTLTFTNVRNEDLDVLYANIPSDDESDLDDDDNIKLAGVDDDGSDDNDSEASDDESSEEDSSDDEDGGNDDADDMQIAIETPELEHNETLNDTEEYTNEGNDGEIPGVDETTGVDETPEMNETAGVDETTGVGNDTADRRSYQAPTDRHGSEGIKMNLRSQARQSYRYDRMGNKVVLGDSHLVLNVKTTSTLPRIAGVASPRQHHEYKHFMFYQMGMEDPSEPHHFMFHQMGIEKCMGMMMLQYNKENNLCETEINEFQIEYVFLTEQMNWKKGLKLFKEKDEDAITTELQQIHDMEGFQPKHWDELTKEIELRL